MAIGDVLLEMIEERLPQASFTKGEPEDALGRFAAAHAEVGGVTLYDDGDEITVYVDNFSHEHFGPRGPGSGAELERSIAQDVIAFLEDLFADRIVLWGTLKGEGGWYLRGEAPESSRGRNRGREYVWSGPLQDGV